MRVRPDGAAQRLEQGGRGSREAGVGWGGVGPDRGEVEWELVCRTINERGERGGRLVGPSDCRDEVQRLCGTGHSGVNSGQHHDIGLAPDLCGADVPAAEAEEFGTGTYSN